MKRFIAACGMFALLGGFVVGSGPGESKGVQSESAALEELLVLTRGSLDMWYGESDPTIFAQTFADKATYFDPWTGGRLDDGAIKEYLMSFLGQVPKLNYEILNPRVDLHGDIATFTFNCNAIDPVSGAITVWNTTEIFMWTNDGWERIHANWNYMEDQSS